MNFRDWNPLRDYRYWAGLFLLVIAASAIRSATVTVEPPLACEPRQVAEAILLDERPQMGELERRFWLDVMTKHFEPRGISVSLAAALGGQETKFQPHLVSSAGARGAWQVMPNVWLGTDECPKGSDLFEVETNAGCAARILARYLHEGGSVEAALRRYVAGPHGQAKAQWYADQTLARMARATQKACPAARGLYTTATTSTTDVKP